MDTGNTFLKSQIDNAVVQHETFLKALEAHEVEADDPRFSSLCARHLPHMRNTGACSRNTNLSWAARTS